MKVKYDGAYPNLCSGHLIITIGDTDWDFGCYSLSSGGSVWFDGHWNEHVEDGPWSIREWPDGFPEELKGAATEAVNDAIPCGCCGGCV